MSSLIIEGGKKLHGTIENQPSKNAAEAILFACVMIRGKVTLVNVPELEGVHQILKLLKSIGVEVRQEKRTIHLDASAKLHLDNIDREASEATRTSLLLLGALAAREKNYTLYRSGGCHLGERTVRPHLYALKKLGVAAACEEGCYKVRNEKLQAAGIVLYESGDTTTENVIMAAVLAPGVTTIKMASANYMVQDLCYFLNKAGANIEGIGTTTLTIKGAAELNPVEEYPIMPDPIVAMTLLSIAITTGSGFTVKNCPLEFLELELCKLEVMGQVYHLKNKRMSENGKFIVVDIEVVPSKLTALPDKIYGRPFPGLNIDNLPLFIPILTQAAGRTMVHDWAYENRAVYGLDLQKLGATVTLLDPHRLWVEGRTTFTPAEADAPPGIRPAVNLLICMLAAKGRSVLHHSDIIERGYEKGFFLGLGRAGAKIELVN